MKTLQVYSRQGCHLCELLIEELLPIVRGQMDVEVLDVDTRPEWVEAYGDRVPVVEVDGQFVCQYQLDRPALDACLQISAKNRA